MIVKHKRTVEAFWSSTLNTRTQILHFLYDYLLLHCYWRKKLSSQRSCLTAHPEILKIPEGLSERKPGALCSQLYLISWVSQRYTGSHVFLSYLQICIFTKCSVCVFMENNTYTYFFLLQESQDNSNILFLWNKMNNYERKSIKNDELLWSRRKGI